MSKPILRLSANPRIIDVPDGRLRSFLRYKSRISNVARALARPIVPIQFDVIHAQAPALAAGALSARLHRAIPATIPIIATAHGTNLPEADADTVSRTIRDRIRALSARATFQTDRSAFQRSDYVIAVSEYQEREMVQLYGVPAEKRRVIHNGVDRALYSRVGPVSGRPEICQLGADPVVLFVGRLVPKKGLQFLVAAFKRIANAVPNARCVVVGGSEIFDTYGAHLRKITRSAGVADRFTWLQAVPEHEMPGIYRRADVCVFPSINYESLPTVALEAMACGVPVVATRGWGTPEALGKSHPGLIEQADVVKIADTVIEFILRRDIADAVRRKQYQQIERFDLRRSAEQHLELYRDAIAARG